MNKERAKKISEIISKLEGIKEEIDTVQSEEQEYYDNMPENMQSGEKGERASDAATALEQAGNDAETAIGNLQEALGDYA